MRPAHAACARSATVGPEKRTLGGLLLVVAVCTLLASVVAAMVFPARSAQGAPTLPPGFALSRVADGLAGPTAMDFAPDGRLFVTEQRGTLRVVTAGGSLTTALDISGRVNSAGERGLLGVAFDPGFPDNRHVYLHYTQKATRNTPAHNLVVRFTLSGDTVVAGSGRLILRLNNLSTAKNHNGGDIHFGQDGKLYVAVGDNANGENAQSLRNLKGKMLRINKDGTIPTTNPFYARASGKNRAIWARGLRNPFKFAVEPGTGAIYINDVGRQTWEEINRGAAGANYGWPRHEGPESARLYVPPIFAYRHDGDPATTGCSITGGAFYDPTTVRFPNGYVGDYFFADFCSGWIRRYDPATDEAVGFATGLDRPVDLKVGNDGSLYYLTRGAGADTGSISEVRYAGS